MSEKVSAAASRGKKVCHALARSLQVATEVHARVRGEFRSFHAKVAKGFFFFFFLFSPLSSCLRFCLQCFPLLPSLRHFPRPLFFRACVRKVDESRARARKKPSFSLLFNSSRGGKNHQLFWVKGRMRSSTVDSHSS